MMAQTFFIRFFIALVYVAIYIISGWLTIELWRSTPTIDDWVAIIIGASLHTALYLFAAAARGLPLAPPIKYLTSVMVLILFAVSIAATVGQLESSYNGAEASTELAKARLSESNRKADIRLKNAEVYANYDRATSSSKQLDSIEADNRDSLVDEIQKQGAMNNLIALVSESFVLSANHVRLYLFLTLAILLDACGIWAALLFFVPVTIKKESRTNSTAPKATMDTAEQDIKKGVFGQYPSVAKLVSRYGIGRGTANGWLKQLSDKQIVLLNEDERRWQVCEVSK